MTDMGEVVIITGGNAGDGKQTAAQLAQKGPATVITSRDLERGEAAAAGGKGLLGDGRRRRRASGGRTAAG
ncbi:MAG: hypothetical protein ACRDWD_04925 [Acidimicrobiia bacterium]